MLEPIISETDPRVILPVNPGAAVVEAFMLLKRNVQRLAFAHGYQEGTGIPAAQFLFNTKVIPSSTLKVWQILKNVRDQAVHLRWEVDVDSARKYLNLIAPEQENLQSLLRQAAKHA
jgi:hypothetical protein